MITVSLGPNADRMGHRGRRIPPASIAVVVEDRKDGGAVDADAGTAEGVEEV